VAARVHAVGGLVYHDVTELKWAQIGLDNGADGLICVNRRAGGHAGQRSMQQLYEELQGLGAPLVCAGGVGSGAELWQALDQGYAACQLGTRFIASDECRASAVYKQAIVDATEDDIVLSERVTGIPVAVINTDFIQRSGTRMSGFSRWMLGGKITKHWMRMFYGLKSIWQLKRSSLDETGDKDYWQAGKSVGRIDRIASCASIMQELMGRER
jgi:nitronate monooxygenase